MKLNKCENTAVNQYELEIAFEPQAIEAAVVKVYNRDKKKYNVPGFRKGRAPRHLIEKMYGENIFSYDAVNDLFPAAYEEAVKEAKLEPVSNPEAEMVSIDAENGAVVKVTIIVKPEIKIGKYKGLTAVKEIQKVSEEEVNAEITRQQERNARLITREGKAENGDIAKIDYEGSVDGVPFEGGKDEGHSLTLGSGQFIPGFEEQLIGHEAGEELDVNVTFPTEYHAPDLAGKEAVFKVKINELQYKEMPELDDEFAKDVSEFDTLAELKDSIRHERQHQLDHAAEHQVEDKLVDQVVETIEGEIPDVMYQNRIDDMVQDFANRLMQQGLNLETYLQYTGMDMQAFRDGFKEQAERAVKMRLVLDEVAKLEKLEADESDLEKEYAHMAEHYNMDVEKIKEIIPADNLTPDLLVNKAIDFIKTNATITEEEAKPAVEEAQEEKPKKKAAKKTTKAKKEESTEE